MRKFLSAVLAAVLVLSLFAVSAVANSTVRTTISLSSTSATMGVGEKIRFVATTNSKNPVTWTSRDTSVATVSKTGVVTALEIGETTIRASVDGVNAFLAITVRKAPSAVGLRDLEVKVGETKRITVLLTKNSASRTRTFESSDTSIAKVDKNGNVTGIKAGTAEITIKTYNDLTATATVTVTNPPPIATTTAATAQGSISTRYPRAGDLDGNGNIWNGSAWVPYNGSGGAIGHTVFMPEGDYDPDRIIGY